MEFESWEAEGDCNPDFPVLPLGSYSYSIPKAELVIISSDDEEDFMQVNLVYFSVNFISFSVTCLLSYNYYEGEANCILLEVSNCQYIKNLRTKSYIIRIAFLRRKKLVCEENRNRGKKTQNCNLF